MHYIIIITISPYEHDTEHCNSKSKLYAQGKQYITKQAQFKNQENVAWKLNYQLMFGIWLVYKYVGYRLIPLIDTTWITRHMIQKKAIIASFIPLNIWIWPRPYHVRRCQSYTGPDHHSRRGLAESTLLLTLQACRRPCRAVQGGNCIKHYY